MLLTPHPLQNEIEKTKRPVKTGRTGRGNLHLSALGGLYQRQAKGASAFLLMVFTLCLFTLFPGSVPAASSLPPIHQAAVDGNLDEVTRLFTEDPSRRDSRDDDGNTPLHHAAWNGQTRVAEFLLRAGTPVDVRVIAPGKSMDGGTPLHDAAVQGQTEMVRVLLKAGAAVDARDAEDNTPLHHATWHNQVETAKALLDAGADVNARRKQRVLPIEMASFYGHEDIMRLLIARGADVNGRVYEGNAPLHQAARNGKTGAMEILVEAGAEIMIRRDDGQTPLHVAAASGQENAVRLLLAMGSDPNATGKDGLTPLALAQKSGQGGTARILTEHLAAVSETEALIAARNAANKKVSATTVAEKTVYQNEFYKETVGGEWSATTIGAFFAPLRTSPIPGREKRLLGDFGDQEVRLALNDLPPHSQATVILNLHLLNTWDGNRSSGNDGPDVWEAQVVGGQNLIRTTFANVAAKSRRMPIQSFPGEWPLEAHPGRTGAVANDILGLPDRPMDSVYRLKFVFSHDNATLVLAFRGKHLSELSDESWAIGSIEVRVGTAKETKQKR